MEHLVRVQNESDRRTLAWLREQVGDVALAAAAHACIGAGRPGKPYVSALCRRLGRRPPWPVRAAVTRTPAHVEVGERHLAAIRAILARPRPAAQPRQRGPAG
ncbi:hypothetical protein J2797_005142 [Paraburkholderia terricola]|uniref:hypothetical protein n=1 Tax=Paraburkholderia terricola TaxID=169427 RepID=UPI002864E4AC|nr:hypothetical protein [Paraburkholderia terricola]MDR6495226.1 hypothetical protein [Paraburkholderia terricola]